jgi:hypothetical protein
MSTFYLLFTNNVFSQFDLLSLSFSAKKILTASLFSAQRGSLLRQKKPGSKFAEEIEVNLMEGCFKPTTTEEGNKAHFLWPTGRPDWAIFFYLPILSSVFKY